MKVDDFLTKIVGARSEAELTVIRSEIEQAETQSLITSLDSSRLNLVIEMASCTIYWYNKAMRP